MTLASAPLSPAGPQSPTPSRAHASQHASSPARWLHPAEADTEATARLFLFHHSGASAAAYASWRAYLPSEIGAQAVQLPGRQERSRETPYTRLEPLVDALADAIGPDLDERPYALFGHSMGALLAYRTAITVTARGWPQPSLLAVSGWAPEGFTPLESAVEDDTPLESAVEDGATADERALAALRGLGDALPAELERDPDALAAVVRAMSADIAVCAGYRDDGASVPCAIAAYAGRDDPLLEPDAMRSWAGRTARFLGCRTFPGEHYYLREHAPAVAADLADLLRRHAIDP